MSQVISQLPQQTAQTKGQIQPPHQLGVLVVNVVCTPCAQEVVQILV